ncbi:MAG: septal ring lytic transglycosylase RlpA family lipoprotein, partial [Pedobacter sp.]
TNLDNGKSVDVVVNDRGPHSKKYMIDVSEAAAKELGFYRKGHSRVEITYQLEAEDL